MAAIIQVILVSCLCSWMTTVDGRYVSWSGDNGSDHTMTFPGRDLSSNTSLLSTDIHFSFPGILSMVTRLSAIMMSALVYKPNPADCTLETDAMECGASMLLEHWNTGYRSIPRQLPSEERVPGSGDERHGPHIGDTYRRRIHRPCVMYEYYKLCLQNRETDPNRCMSPTHTTVQTLYEYICQPNVTRDLIISGQCISGVTTEKILSRYGEACRADYAGFGMRMLWAITGLGPRYYTYSELYDNCYVPGVWYYCGEAASRIYRGLVAQLERVAIRADRVITPGLVPSSYRQTYTNLAKYHHTEAGRQELTHLINEAGHYYRDVSRELGSCSASGLTARMNYCVLKSLADMDINPPDMDINPPDMDINPPDMEFACRQNGTLAQFISCYQPAVGHCQLTGDHNATDVITKVCSAFRSASTSDYCLPPLSVANSYLRACDMGLLLFVDYSLYLNMESKYMLYTDHNTPPVTIGSQRNCLRHVKDIEGDNNSRGCGSVDMKNILAGLKVLAGWPRLLAELWDTAREEKCSLTHMCKT